MKRACWAVFFHSISTDNHPQHQCCLVGTDSWCKYQRALALNQEIPQHTLKIPLEFSKYLQPVFKDLCDDRLLKKCLLGATQSRNESFNNLVWARAPKTEYTGRDTDEVATSQAAIVFNSGRCAMLPLLEPLGINAGPYLKTYLETHDKVRTKRAS